MISYQRWRGGGVISMPFFLVGLACLLWPNLVLLTKLYEKTSRNVDEDEFWPTNERLLRNTHGGNTQNNSMLGVSTMTTIDSHVPKRAQNVLVTGGAGFIGMYASILLQEMGNQVVIYDNLNEDIYSPELKLRRLEETKRHRISFVQGDVCDFDLLNTTICDNKIDAVVHLASQSSARVDGAVKRMFQYPPNNVDCFGTLLDILKESNKVLLVYASSLSTYRTNRNSDGLENRERRRDEMVALAYYRLYGITSIGLRFGTVLGPWARPDMMYYEFANQKMQHGNVNQFYKHALGKIGFLHVNDAVDGIIASLNAQPNGADIFSFMGEIQSEKEFLQLIEKNFAFAFTQGIGPIRDTSTIRASTVGSSSAANKTLPALGINEFVQWFVDHNGTKYAHANRHLEEGYAKQHVFKEASELCFTTAMFSDQETGRLRRKERDIIERSSIAAYNHSHPFRYFFFTDIPDLKCNGWERIVIEDFPFRRVVTKSRWPKFLGFDHPQLQNCRVIFYSDSNLPPRKMSHKTWAGLARRVIEKARAGVMQDKRLKRQSALSELKGVVNNRKDIPDNVAAMKEWLLDQPDFSNEATGYWNMAMVFDPYNEKMRTLVTTFWAQYSAEKHSWRDQPLWRYIVHKLKIRPIYFTQNMGHRLYWRKKLKGTQGLHKYTKKHDGSVVS